MQKDANTILLFTDHREAIDYLSDEDAGKLIKALFAYVDEGKLPDFNGQMMSLFTVIRTQIDRSHEAYKVNARKTVLTQRNVSPIIPYQRTQVLATHRKRT